MRTICIIQSRLGSARLPGKALLPIDGKPMIQHVVERARQIAQVTQVVLAVPKCDVDAYVALNLDCAMYGGSELDVLDRYTMAARAFRADRVMRITGDCPLLSPLFGDMGLHYFANQPIKYLALCQPYCHTADGWDIEIFTMALLEEAHRRANADEREHVVTWMRNNVLVETMHPMKDYSPLTCSVNTQADLERVRLIFDRLDDMKDYRHQATWDAWELAGRP